jgi:hypothetical protein
MTSYACTSIGEAGIAEIATFIADMHACLDVPAMNEVTANVEIWISCGKTARRIGNSEGQL